jgi:hypothetical protein
MDRKIQPAAAAAKTRSLCRAGGVTSLAVLAAIGLAACNDGADNGAPPPVTVTPTPSPAPTPAPTPTPTSFNVTSCLNQTIPGTGFTVAQAVVPDTLTLTLSAASGFPNGRRLPDPVIDVTLAVIFLDLTRHSPALLAGLPVNPSANDQPFRTAFPYLAPPQGSPPLAATGGSSFNFRTDGPSSYVRVDRMGMPAVATALIGSSAKTAYNAADPANDANGDFVPELTAQLTGLTNALADDLTRLGLTPCARPN